MKKSQMLSFLFWTVLALIIFVPTVLFASKFLNFNTKLQEDFNNLVGAIDSLQNPLQDGEIRSTGFYLEDKSIIAGFAKNSKQFENHEYFYDRTNPDATVFILNRPSSCESQKACICLCKNFDFKVTGADVYTPECEKPICKSFDNIDFLHEKVVRTYGNGKPQFSWKGGFLHLRNVPAVANGLEQNQIGTRTFYIQKYKNFIDVCLNSPCITDDIKEQINKNDAISSFNAFVNKYGECKSSGKCGALSIRQHWPFYIYYFNSENKDKAGFYLVKGDFSKSFAEMKIVKNSDGTNIFYQGIAYKDEANEISTGNALNGPELEFTLKNSKVILGFTKTFDISLG